MFSVGRPRVTSDIKMARRLNILDLAADILHLIVEQLGIDSPSSVLPLAKVSRACNRLAIPVLYRSITLKDDDQSERHRRVVENLLDPFHAISQHVRELTVSEFGKHPETLDGAKLERIVGNMQNLTSFRYVIVVSYRRCIGT
jgi:hypothetical protein